MCTRKDMVHGAKRSSPIQWIDRNVDIISYSDNKDDYIVYMREKKAIIKHNRKLCYTKYTTCPEKVGKIIPMENNCLNKIPIEAVA